MIIKISVKNGMLKSRKLSEEKNPPGAQISVTLVMKVGTKIK